MPIWRNRHEVMRRGSSTALEFDKCWMSGTRGRIFWEVNASVETPTLCFHRRSVRPTSGLASVRTTLTPFVQAHGHDDHRADDDFLDVGIPAELVGPIAQNRHQECTHQ